MKERRAEEASRFPSQVVTEDAVIRDGVTMPRYITLSDGQVLDRAYKPDIKPLSSGMLQVIRASNKANSEFKPNRGKIPARFNSFHYKQDHTQPPPAEREAEEQG